MNTKSASETIRGLADDAAAITTICLLFAAPLFMGGRHGIGVWVYVLATLPAAISLAAKAHFGTLQLPSKRVLALLLAIMLIPLAQSMTIPAEFGSMMAPGVERLSAGEVEQPWPNTLGRSASVVPSISKQGLAIALVYVVVFLNFFSTTNSLADTKRLLRWIVISIAFIAGIALLQASGLGNGKFLWMYDHPTRDPGTIPRGPFQNENHLCSLIAIAVPIAIGFVLMPFFRSKAARCQFSNRGVKPTGTDWDQLIGGLAIVIFCTTVYATPSRGGAALVVSGALVLGSLVFWNFICQHHLVRLHPNAPTWGWWLYGAFFTVSIAALFTQIHQFSYWRYKIYSSNLQMFADFPVFGVGVGSHRYVYRSFLDQYFPQTFTHAESSIIQIASETGIIGCLLCVSAVAIVVLASCCLFKSETGTSTKLLNLGMMSALLVSLIHACFDFNLHVPACLVPVLALAAVVVRTAEDESQTTNNGVRNRVQNWFGSLIDPVRIGACGACAILIIAAFSQSKLASADLAWDRYRRICRDDDLTELPALQIKQSIIALRDCLHYNPVHVLAHVRLSQCYLTMAGSLPARKREQALATARVFAQKAARLAPTQPEAPWLYAEAEIMRTGDLLTQKQLLRHANKLRPTDGRSLGRLALIAQIEGKLPQAEELWRRAIQLDPSTYRHTLNQLLIFEGVSEILSKYQPPLAAAEILLELQDREGDRSADPQLRAYLAAKYAELAEQALSDRIAEHYYLRAFHYLSRTGGTKEIIELQEKRVARNPQLIDNRLVLTQYLIANAAFERSKHHLEICRQIDPRNERLGQLTIAQRKMLLDQTTERR